jgi:hypothetical protein
MDPSPADSLWCRVCRPLIRANLTSETDLMNTAGVGKIVRVTSAVVTGAIALSG